MELLALFIVKERRTVAKKIPVVNSLLNEDEGSSEKKKLAVFNRSRLSTNLLNTKRREYEMTVIRDWCNVNVVDELNENISS